MENQRQVREEFHKFDEALKKGNLDQVADFYHPEAVIVHRGKRCFYGRPEIRNMFDDFYHRTGKCQCDNRDKKYESMGDWVVVSGLSTNDTENLGHLEGSFTQVWHRDDHGRWGILHDEFEVKDGHFVPIKPHH